MRFALPKRPTLDAFMRLTLRTIRSSVGRFLAIVGIVALGCGFYAGLQMCGPDMREAADAFYDGCNLYDIRVVSTMGFGERDVERLTKVSGVSAAMPAKSCDIMARIGNGSYACRVSSIDVDAAEEGEEGANAILSDDGTYLNRVFLCEGRWPRGPTECVVSADRPLPGIEVGGTIEALFGTESLDDLLRERTFEIVGLVSSAAYPYTARFGSTTLGSGIVTEYLYVADDAFAPDCPFTEIYLRVEGADLLESGSDAYDELVSGVEGDIEDRSEDLADSRRADLVEDAQREVDEGKSELEQKRAEAAAQFEQAETELKEADAKIAEGRSSLESGLAEWEKGRAEAETKLADAARQLEDGTNKVAQDRAALEADEEYAKTREQELLEFARTQDAYASNLVSARLKLKAQESQLSLSLRNYEARTEAIAAIADLRAQIADAETRLAQTGDVSALTATQALTNMSLDSAMQTLSDLMSGARTPLSQMIADATVSSAQRRVDELKTRLDDVNARLQEAVSATAARDAAAAELGRLERRLNRLEQNLKDAPKEEELRARLTSVTEGISAIDELMRLKLSFVGRRAELALAESQIDSGTSTLDSQRAQAEEQLAEGRAKLDEAARELEEGETKAAEGRDELERQKADALSRFDEAERELADAQVKIDDVETPEIYVLDRTKSEGTYAYDADSRRMDAIANVFPLIFFLVAALVSLTTMTRMVAEERIEIGTYKALGYSKLRIASKYLIYAGAASAIGALIGILILSQVLPMIVTHAYSIIYTVPQFSFPIPMKIGTALISGGLGVAITLVATLVSVLASLKETPSNLMLPRAPTAGKRILLERTGPLWRHISFLWKVTLRNLFRYKARLAMTVIGIAGCTALLLSGFGVRDAVWDIIDFQYGPIVHYEAIISFDEEAKENDIAAVLDYLEASKAADNITRVQANNMLAAKDAAAAKDHTDMLQVVVPKEHGDLKRGVTLRDRLTQEEIPFDDESVVVTEKLARLLGVGVGDDFMVFKQDAIGNASGTGTKLVVTGICENYVGNYVYVGRTLWERARGESLPFSSIEFYCDKDADARQRLSDDVLRMSHVSTIAFTDESIETYRNTLAVVDGVVLLLIVCAGLLAFIVLYNLTNINIEERIREIASLKVLGFTQGEVYAYIFREIIVLSLMGDVVGLVLGTFMSTFVVTTVEVDSVMFGRTIHSMSYGLSFAITLIYTVLILIFMRKKLDHVNMVESLKSID